MKYYIKAFFGEWTEVSKEKFERFRNNILVGAINVDKSNPEEVENFLSRHSKVEVPDEEFIMDIFEMSEKEFEEKYKYYHPEFVDPQHGKVVDVIQELYYDCYVYEDGYEERISIGD